MKFRSQKHLADKIEENFFLTTVIDQTTKHDEDKSNEIEASYSSKLRQTRKKFQEKLEKFKITEEIAFPPTMAYLPSYELLTFMINRAAKAI